MHIWPYVPFLEIVYENEKKISSILGILIQELIRYQLALTLGTDTEATDSGSDQDRRLDSDAED